MNADGSSITQLTNSGNASPVWSPDGRKLAFTSGRDGTNQIYVMNAADGSNQVRITSDTGVRPAWSPDGQKIAFSGAVGTNSEVVVMNADGSNPINLTNHPSTDFIPDWAISVPSPTPSPTPTPTPLSRFTINDVSQNEGNGGPTSFVFTVTRTGATGSGSSVNYTTFEGTAIAGVDYQSTSGTLFFTAGETTKTITVTVIGDTLIEGNETFSVILSNASGAVISDAVGAGTIINDDPPPTPTPTPTPQAGPNTPLGTNVTTTNPRGNVSVNFSSVTSGGTTSFTPINPTSPGQLPIPIGFTALGGETAYEISTTAVVTPPIVVCFNVNNVSDASQFAFVRILHGENGQLVDRTILAPDSPAPDFATRRVCARVNSLSPFVAAMAPPTSNVTVSGRVLTPSGLGLRNAIVAITDAQGVRRTATTSSFGVYTCDSVRSGESYFIGVSSKLYRFATQTVSVSGNLTNIDFVGLE